MDPLPEIIIWGYIELIFFVTLSPIFHSTSKNPGFQVGPDPSQTPALIVPWIKVRRTSPILDFAHPASYGP